MRKDFEIEIDGVAYKIRNIPYELYDAEGEEFIDLGSAIKLQMIITLMKQNDIPHDVDFTVVEDLKFSSTEDDSNENNE